VEANPLAAHLVSRAEGWAWSSLSRSTSQDGRPLLAPSPVPRPDNWLEVVNEKLPIEVSSALRAASQRQVGFGDPDWLRALEDRGHSTLSVPGDCHD
jgi:hypothetical protein